MDEAQNKVKEKELKTNRKYLLGLTALVIVAMLGTIGGMVFASAVPVEKPVSNVLTLDGTCAPVMITLEWAGVAGGTVVGTGATVVWYNGVSYPVSVKATNTTTELISGVYGKLTGWDKTKVKIEFWNTALDPDAWTDLGADAVSPRWCGYFVDSVYYFGPKPGDSYAAGRTETFAFKMTPLVAGSIDVALVLVNGVTNDPR